MKLQDIIESLSSPVKVQKNIMGSSFTVDGQVYNLIGFAGYKENHPLAPDNAPDEFWVAELSNSSVPRDQSDKITGTGNAFKVFATALKILREKQPRGRYRPWLIAASLDEPSRVKLYSRMFDKIATHKWKDSMKADKDNPEMMSSTPTHQVWIIP